MRLAVPRWRDGKCPNGDVNLITGEDGLARKGGFGPISSSGRVSSWALVAGTFCKSCAVVKTISFPLRVRGGVLAVVKTISFPLRVRGGVLVNAELTHTVLSLKKLELSKAFSLKPAVGQNIALAASHAAGTICLISLALVHSALVLFQHKATCGVNSGLDR